MASQKTLPNDAGTDALIAAVTDPARREDALRMRDLLAGWTGEPPVLWGSAIVGFGTYHYRYESGREGTSPLVGFSPRKANLVLYLAGQDRPPELLERLGPHKAGRGCVYIKRLADVDETVLRELVAHTLRAHRGADAGG